MLTAYRDAGRAISCCDDVVYKAGKRGNGTNEEGGDSTPVAGVSGRVPVDAVEIIHVGDGDVTSSDNVVAVAQTGY